MDVPTLWDTGPRTWIGAKQVSLNNGNLGEMVGQHAGSQKTSDTSTYYDCMVSSAAAASRNERRRCFFYDHCESPASYESMHSRRQAPGLPANGWGNLKEGLGKPSLNCEHITW